MALTKKLIILLFSIFYLAALLQMIHLSLFYIHFDPYIAFLETKQNVYDVLHWRVSFYVHVFSSVLLLVSGILQFMPFILKKYPKIHHISGYVYFSVLLVFSGPSAIVMAFYANGGLAAKTSFVVLSILWNIFSWTALILVLKKRFVQHGNFMLRSFALTLSALSLRLYAFVLTVFHVQAMPGEKYTMIAWLSWVPNLLVAEWLIQAGIIRKWFYPKKT